MSVHQLIVVHTLLSSSEIQRATQGKNIHRTAPKAVIIAPPAARPVGTMPLMLLPPIATPATVAAAAALAADAKRQADAAVAHMPLLTPPPVVHQPTDAKPAESDSGSGEGEDDSEVHEDEPPATKAKIAAVTKAEGEKKKPDAKAKNAANKSEKKRNR